MAVPEWRGLWQGPAANLWGCKHAYRAEFPCPMYLSKVAWWQWRTWCPTPSHWTSPHNPPRPPDSSCQQMGHYLTPGSPRKGCRYKASLNAGALLKLISALHAGVIFIPLRSWSHRSWAGSDSTKSWDWWKTRVQLTSWLLMNLSHDSPHNFKTFAGRNIIDILNL